VVWARGHGPERCVAHSGLNHDQAVITFLNGSLPAFVQEAAPERVEEAACTPEAVVAHEDGVGRTPLSVAERESGDAERALVEACRAGHAWAFEELYRTHGGRMKSVAMNLLGDTSDAEDAVQEAFLKLYSSLPSFKGNALLSTWLFRILVNTCHDIGRRRGRSLERPLPALDPASVPEPSAPAVDHPLRLTLERFMKRLEPLPRAVFVLFEVEGFKHGEIAQILGIPEGTSRYSLFAAKKELQGLILASRRGKT